jgi:DmsE family decaheme c-type cytochrome
MTSCSVRGNGLRAATPGFWLACCLLLSAIIFAPTGLHAQKAGGAAAKVRAAQASAATDGATFVGQEACASCHEEKIAEMAKTLHGKSADRRTPAGGQSCEACHGPGSKHADDPEKNSMRKFGKVSSNEITAVCTTCHATGEHALWAGSKHEARGVSCATCHSVHSAKGAKLMKTETQPKLCAGCHQQIVNKINRFNHMPVREDKLACSSCHNLHGSTNGKLLRAGTTVDESCTSCHAEKRGPYLWEHAPVANACVTCHDPHGSSNERMLVSKVPFLCQRCHVTSRHPPTVYDGFVLKNSSNANKMTGRGCVACHSQIHGSNSPNGKAFLR